MKKHRRIKEVYVHPVIRSIKKLCRCLIVLSILLNIGYFGHLIEEEPKAGEIKFTYNEETNVLHSNDGRSFDLDNYYYDFNDKLEVSEVPEVVEYDI